MPNTDGTGPIGIGPKNGRGRKQDGIGQTSKETGTGNRTGGKKGTC